MNNLNLSNYLDGLRAAKTASELDLAIRAPFKHSYTGPTWATICKVTMECGFAICDAHLNGRFVPRLDGGILTICGEYYRVGRGRNSTGIRYAWHAAGAFAKDVLQRNGFSRRAASRIWDTWDGYPHRCLAIINDALNGQLRDPPVNRLVFSHIGTGPIRMTDAANDADEADRRATRPCGCGGTRFDWGSGFSDGFTFVNWHCNKCHRVYVEYVTPERFAEIRQPQNLVARANTKADPASRPGRFDLVSPADCG